MKKSDIFTIILFALMLEINLLIIVEETTQELEKQNHLTIKYDSSIPLFTFVAHTIVSFFGN